MAKYKKKPVIVEAFRLGVDHWPDWFAEPHGRNEITTHGDAYPLDRNAPFYAIIRTLEGSMRADYLDWIIRGVKGELYPCKPEIFEATYERVEEASEHTGGSLVKQLVVLILLAILLGWLPYIVWR